MSYIFIKINVLSVHYILEPSMIKKSLNIAMIILLKTQYDCKEIKFYYKSSNYR